MPNNYEPGRYTARVIRQGFGVERKGTEFFFLTIRPLRISRDEYEQDVKYEGDRDVKLHLTDKTVDFQLDILRSLGWGGTDFQELANGTHSFVGQEIEVSCDHREWKGKYYDQFQIFASGPKDADEEVVSYLTEKFSDKLKSTANPELPKRAALPAEESSDDDMPF